MTEKNTKSKTIQTFVDTLKNFIITMYMPNNKLNQFTKSITETFSNTWPKILTWKKRALKVVQ